MLDRSVYQPSELALRFHRATADEVLFGGAAGGGKSLSLLFDPLVTQAVVEHARMTGDIPEGFPEWLKKLCRMHPIRPGESEGHALHLRRTMPQLEENIARSLRMFPKFDPNAVYARQEHRWTFASGYQFSFGHCRERDSHQDYLSKQFTHFAVDESSMFEEFQIDELDARVRSADPVLSKLLRTRFCSNPAQGWLKKRFIDPAPKGNKILRVRVPDPATGEMHYRERLFLPAKLDDNPDKEFVRQYKIRLLSKPAHIRARYLYGDWDSADGAFFEDDWNPSVHRIEPFKVPRHWPKFRSMDWGFRAPGSIGWYAMDDDDRLYEFYEFNFKNLRDREVAERVIDIEKQFGFWNKRENHSRLQGVADTQLWEERGDSGKSKAQVFLEKGVWWKPADKASMARNAERICERLRDYDSKRAPMLQIFSNCRQTCAMFGGIKMDDNDSTVVDKKSPLKHWFDKTAYAAAHASRGRSSISMEMHEFDRPEPDEYQERPRGGGFGYGVA